MMNGLFSDYLYGKSISFKHARGSSDRSGNEFHIYHEIILFIDGEAEFISEKLHMHLKPNTLIVIPNQTYHQLVVHGNQENYYRCVLQFEESEELSEFMNTGFRDVQLFPANREIRFLFDKLIRAVGTDESHATLLLHAVLILLLDTIRDPKDVSNGESHQNEVLHSAIEYINGNLDKTLTIHKIAQACNVSDSLISQVFKKEMHVPIHKFIIEKRLMRAYQRICAGEAATVVAIECGFKDYSGFYKQYKKALGFSPSQKHNKNTSKKLSWHT